jgi:hypothetical protein
MLFNLQTMYPTIKSNILCYGLLNSGGSPVEILRVLSRFAAKTAPEFDNPMKIPPFSPMVRFFY